MVKVDIFADFTMSHGAIGGLAGAGGSPTRRTSGTATAGSVAALPGSAGNPSGIVRTIKEVTCQRSLEFDLVRFTWNVENFNFYRDSRGVLYDVLESPRKGCLFA